jgi:hypothetical protein
MTLTAPIERTRHVTQEILDRTSNDPGRRYVVFLGKLTNF